MRAFRKKQLSKDPNTSLSASPSTSSTATLSIPTSTTAPISSSPSGLFSLFSRTSTSPSASNLVGESSTVISATNKPDRPRRSLSRDREKDKREGKSQTGGGHGGGANRVQTSAHAHGGIGGHGVGKPLPAIIKVNGEIEDMPTPIPMSAPPTTTSMQISMLSAPATSGVPPRVSFDNPRYRPRRGSSNDGTVGVVPFPSVRSASNPSTRGGNSYGRDEDDKLERLERFEDAVEEEDAGEKTVKLQQQQSGVAMRRKRESSLGVYNGAPSGGGGGGGGALSFFGLRRGKRSQGSVGSESSGSVVVVMREREREKAREKKGNLKNLKVFSQSVDDLSRIAPSSPLSPGPSTATRRKFPASSGPHAPGSPTIMIPSRGYPNGGTRQERSSIDEGTRRPSLARPMLEKEEGKEKMKRKLKKSTGKLSTSDSAPLLSLKIEDGMVGKTATAKEVVDSGGSASAGTSADGGGGSASGSAKKSSSFDWSQGGRSREWPLVVEDRQREKERRESRTILYSGFLQKKSDYPPPTSGWKGGGHLLTPNPTSQGFFQPSSPFGLYFGASSSANAMKGGGAGTGGGLPGSPSMNSMQSVDLSKNWKPFKVVLKGSKLYLYKLPSEMANTAKTLFPTKLVEIDHVSTGRSDGGGIGGENTEEGGMNGGDKGNGGGQATGGGRNGRPSTADGLQAQGRRRARVYWGTKRHPDLVVESGDQQEDREGKGKIVKGSLDAFVHEMTFATSFGGTGGLDNEKTSVEYDTFVRTILVGYQLWNAGGTKMKVELERCVDLAFRTVENEKNGQQGEGEDATVDEDKLKKRLKRIGQVWIDEFEGDMVDGDGYSSIGKLLESLLERLDGDDLVQDLKERLKKTIEFKGATLRLISTTDVLVEVRPPYARSPSSSSAATTQARPDLKPLYKNGMTADILVNLDPVEFAQQLHLFHFVRWSNLSNHADELRITLKTGQIFATVPEYARSQTLGSGPAYLLQLFSFEPNERPHFLSHIIFSSLFPTVGTLKLIDQSTNTFSVVQSSTPLVREKATLLISWWIEVGEQLRLLGDEAGWAAVAQSICSAPVLRLQKIWYHVPQNLHAVIYDIWTPRLASIGCSAYAASGEEAKVKGIPGKIPYFGSILQDVAKLVSNLTPNSPLDAVDQPVDYSQWSSISQKLERTLISWRTSKIPGNAAKPHESVFDFQMFFSGFAKHVVEAQYPCRALDCFPASKQLEAPISTVLEFEKVTSFNQNSILLACSPLFFSRPVPVLEFVDRDIIIDKLDKALRWTENSKPSPDFSPDSSLQKLARRQSYPPPTSTRRVNTLKRIRKEMDLSSDDGSTCFSFGDGDLVLKVKGDGRRRSKELGSRASIVTVTPNIESPTPSTLSADQLLVTVKSGTVERLLDILVLGVERLKTPPMDDNGQSAFGSDRTLTIDLNNYRQTFFKNLKIFAPPLSLFSELKKRFYGAHSATADATASANPFPTWPSPTILEKSFSEDALLLQTRVLLSFKTWVEFCPQDFKDDPMLSRTLMDFISTLRLSSDQKENSETAHMWTSAKNSLIDAFDLNGLRPPPAPIPLVMGDSQRQLQVSVLSAEDLVSQLDAMAGLRGRNIFEQDLYSAIQILYSVAKSPTGYHQFRPIPSTDDSDMIIADIYQTLHVLLPRFNESLQMYLGLRQTMVRWLTTELSDPDLNVWQRQERIEKYLDAIAICRRRMQSMTLIEIDHRSKQDLVGPLIPSFVERALVSALLSPESRLFNHAWKNAVEARDGVSESLITLIKPLEQTLTETSYLHVDLGWILERSVEILVATGESSDQLIDFQRLQLLTWFLSHCLSTEQSRASPDTFLGTIEPRNLSMRVLRSCALYEEGLSSPVPGQAVKALAHPFQSLVQQQHDKARRDRSAKDKLLRDLKSREKEKEKAFDLAKIQEQQASNAVGRSRRMTALFRSVLPSAAPPQELMVPSNRALSVLKAFDPVAASQKPYQVITLDAVSLTTLNNNQRSFVFELSVEDGNRSLFQAKDLHEWNIWIKAINQAAITLATKRATFLLTQPPVETTNQPEHFIKGAGSSSGQNAVYSVHLYDLLEKEQGTIPLIVEKCLSIVERRGLGEVGIYRISGETKVINTMKETFDKKGAAKVDLESGPFSDCHNITGALKLWLRELPDSVIPHSFYHRFVDTASISDYNEKMYTLRDHVWKLPQPHFLLLRRLAEHLFLVSDHEQENSMQPHSLAIVFTPSLLQPPPSPASFGVQMQNLGKATSVIKLLIIQAHWIFRDDVEEQEQEQEQEER